MISFKTGVSLTKKHAVDNYHGLLIGSLQNSWLNTSRNVMGTSFDHFLFTNGYLPCSVDGAQ